MITISPYSPLIQLLAGFYLLFWYERFFIQNPLHAQNNIICTSISNFILRYQGLISVDHYNEIEVKIKKMSANWDKYSLTIRKIYFVYFIYCLILLIYIGSEDIILRPIYHYGLQFIFVGTIIYSILMCLSIKKVRRILRKYESITIYFLILIFLYCFFYQINNWLDSLGMCYFKNMNISLISLLSVFTCFIGILITLFHIFVTYTRLFSFKRIETRLSNYIINLLDVMINGDANKLPSRAKRKYSLWLEKNNYDVSKLDKFVKEEVDKELNNIIDPCFGIKKFFRKIKNKILPQKTLL